MLEELTPHARQFAEALAPGRYKASALPAMWSAMHGRIAPKNIAGAAWRAAGLTPYKTAGVRCWVRPEALPPLQPAAGKPARRAKKPKATAVVDLSAIGLKPGDGFAVFYAPDCITIRPA